MVSTTGEARKAFVADAKSDQGGFVEVERELRFGTCGIFVHQTTVDAYDLQRAFLEIVSLLRIQREDLPGYLAVSYNERCNGFRPQSAHRFEAMPAIRSPETSLRCDHSDNRVEKTPGFIDDISEPFVMSIGEIPLERGGLDGIDRQNREQDKVPAERVLVRSHHAAAGLLDRLRHLRGSSRRLIQPAFGWAQTLRSGFRLARAFPGWCTFDHGRGSILVPDGLSLVADHGHNDGALPPTHVAFEMEDLLPRT